MGHHEPPLSPPTVKPIEKEDVAFLYDTGYKEMQLGERPEMIDRSMQKTHGIYMVYIKIVATILNFMEA